MQINHKKKMKPLKSLKNSSGLKHILDTTLEIFSGEFQKNEAYQKNKRLSQELLIGSLITGKAKPPQIPEAQMEKLYENLKTNLYVGVVEIIQAESTLTHLAYYRDLFEKIQSEYKYYVHSNNIVIVISTDSAVLSIKKHLMKLNEFWGKHEIYAGISSGFQNLFELSKFYKEALNALNYGLNTNRKQRIFTYDEIRVEHFLNSIKDKIDLQPIYSQVFFSIREYDQENNSSLLEILYTYMLYGGDFQITCHILRMSPEKLRKQLKILEDDFEIDLRNGNILLNVFLSIKLLEILPR